MEYGKLMLKLCLLALLVGTVSGCATKSELQAVNQRLSALETQGDADQKRVNDLQADVKEVRTQIAGVAGVVKDEAADLKKKVAEVEASVAGVKKVLADTQADKDNVGVDMQTLRGTVDEQVTAVKKLTDEVSFNRDDLVRKVAAVSERAEKLETEVEKVRSQLENSAKTKDAEIEADPALLFKRAMAEQAGGKLAEARASFELFRDKHPEHALLAEALLHLGEVLEKDARHEDAILTFQEIIKNHPSAKEKPAAMLRQAQCFLELKDTANARYLARQIVENYPGTPEAATAATLIDKDKPKPAKQAKK